MFFESRIHRSAIAILGSMRNINESLRTIVCCSDRSKYVYIFDSLYTIPPIAFGPLQIQNITQTGIHPDKPPLSFFISFIQVQSYLAVNFWYRCEVTDMCWLWRK